MSRKKLKGPFFTYPTDMETHPYMHLKSRRWRRCWRCWQWPRLGNHTMLCAAAAHEGTGSEQSYRRRRQNNSSDVPQQFNSQTSIKSTFPWACSSQLSRHRRHIGYSVLMQDSCMADYKRCLSGNHTASCGTHPDSPALVCILGQHNHRSTKKRHNHRSK